MSATNRGLARGVLWHVRRRAWWMREARRAPTGQLRAYCVQHARAINRYLVRVIRGLLPLLAVWVMAVQLVPHGPVFRWTVPDCAGMRTLTAELLAWSERSRLPVGPAVSCAWVEQGRS